MNQSRNTNILQFIIHFIAWGIVFVLPFLIFGKDVDINIWDKMLHHAVVVSSMLLVFYLNYFLLIEKILFKRKIWKFLFYNILLVIITGISLHFWQEASRTIIAQGKDIPHGTLPAGISFMIRDIITLLVIAILSIAIKMTAKWYTTEMEHQEEAKKRTQAELTNLRQQLNPHFLFNTLNNIYALIELSPQKAQSVVLELSKLLRYVLYENTENTVLLHQETDFIKNYVELMRIRLTENVDVKMNINIAGYENAGIAPMLFISLVENAFKHGISPNQRSFIHMSFDINSKNTLTCSIQNSFFPKEDSDMTGSGIGIENLRRRLELLFPENHEFHTGELDGIYYSKIVIPLQIIEKL